MEVDATGEDTVAFFLPTKEMTCTSEYAEEMQ